MVKKIAEGFFKLALVKLNLADPDEESVKRLATCYECNDRSESCPECGCFVQAKVLVDSEKCPLDKW